jgi:hypothetical protein
MTPVKTPLPRIVTVPAPGQAIPGSLPKLPGQPAVNPQRVVEPPAPTAPKPRRG